MLQKFNFKIAGIGDIPISASSWDEAREILQAYIDKRSLNLIIVYDG